MLINKILIKPKITEKALKKAASSIYTFEVGKNANKYTIKTAVEEMFNVKVAEVKTVSRKGKVRRVGRRMKSKKGSDKKIAYIKVKSGKIDLFPQS